MSKYEMTELARLMDRAQENFKIMSDDDEPDVIAVGIEYGSREWNIIIDALRIAGAKEEPAPVRIIQRIPQLKVARSVALLG